MKRLVTLLFATALVLGFQAPSQAVDVKVSGSWEIGMGWADNIGFSDAKQGGGHSDMFSAAQRVRPQFDFIADDTLRAVLALETYFTWGNREEGGQLDADQATFVVRRAYLDWSPADKLNIRMGMQGVALPSAAFGNPVLDTDVAGIVASYKFTDNVALTAFWLRPFDRSYYGADQQDGQNVADDMDMFGLSLPITGQGFSVTPWAMYARNGNASDYWGYRADYNGNAVMTDMIDANQIKGSSNMWWVGAAIELDMLEPISFKLDAMYGRSTSSGDRDMAPEYSGFLLAGLIEYKSEAWWGNPGLIAWYGSGDDSDDYKDGEFGRMPIVSADNAGFAPAGYGFSGSMGCMQDGLISQSGVGLWGLGLQLDGISLIDKLSHTLRVVYVRGTNDEDMIKKTRNGIEARGYSSRLGSYLAGMGEGVYMTKEDQAWEFDFVSTYEVNENLTIYLETNYIVMDLDSGVWGNRNSDTTNAWKAQLLFEYTF
ncbi:outer membrane homotrimeric porin [Desulfovibrio sp. OttesenSCG-928-O18]|nr:outer membrane homotrimeric porin [Desulfovibrio sp. OttesenSCG-928-O18]